MEFSASILQHSFSMIIFVLAIVTIPGLVVGLVVALFQAVTQVHEISLTFIPKIIVTLLALIVLSSVYGPMLLNFTHDLYVQIPQRIG